MRLMSPVVETTWVVMVAKVSMAELEQMQTLVDKLVERSRWQSCSRSWRRSWRRSWSGHGTRCDGGGHGDLARVQVFA